MRYLAALFLLIAFAGHGEPLYPVLTKAKADSLRRKLWRSPPDTGRVKLLLLLSHDFASRSYEEVISLDTAAAYTYEAQSLSKKLDFVAGQLDSQYALAYYFFGKRQQQEAKKAAQLGLVASQQRHDAYHEALGWYLLAYTYPATDSVRRLQHFKKAARLFQAAHTPQYQARSLKNIADIHLQQGRLVLAQQELLRVLSLYQRSGYRPIHYTLDLLGATSMRLGDFQKAIKYSLATIQSAKSTQDTTSLGFFYGRAGDVYGWCHQLEKGIYYYQLALRHAELNHDNPLILDASYGIVNDLFLLNKPKQALAFLLQRLKTHPPQNDIDRLFLAEGLTKCYLGTKQYEQAGQTCAQMITLLKTNVIKGNYSFQMQMYRTIGNYYLATHGYSKAKLALTEELIAAKHVNNRPHIATVYLSLFQADSAQGHLLAAISYYKRFKNLTDSILTASTRKQLAVLQLQKESEKREQSIAMLTKQTQVQQANLGRQQTQRNAILASAILLSLLLGVSYNRYLIKQRSNQLLETKQLEIDQKNQTLEQVLEEKDGLLVEKEWMLKEIHHRVKNNLQIVNELLDSQVDYLRDSQTLGIVRESQNRIQAMALIHQKLYQSQSLSRVNMQEYIREIVEHLVLSFDRQDSVRTCLEVSAIELDVSVATPLGLIINEAVTNSLKYAFPGGRTGTLTISLAQGAGRYHLLLADDGIGLPSGMDITKSRTMGLVMIRGLSEQLNATLTFEPGAGTRISLDFMATRKPASSAQVAQSA
jgi:two-component sensor histidine kinase